MPHSSLCVLLLSVMLQSACWGQVSSTVHSDGAVIRESRALTEFLSRFDPIAKRGFVRTMRPGATGVGFTLESLLGIRENNSPKGDFLGMEVKAYRDDATEPHDREKMNLFLKEPVWLDGKSTADRIRDYGYTDSNGRRAWYQSVTCRRNTVGLVLVVDRQAEVVRLFFDDHAIGQWSFEILQQRLNEKLTEVVFVAAASRGTGADEEFYYQTVTYYSEPSVEMLLRLIEVCEVILELRMHIRPTGGARNHGTAFRIRKNRLGNLYRVKKVCRSAAGSSDQDS